MSTVKRNNSKNKSSSAKSDYFNVTIEGLAYLNRIKQVEHNGNTFFTAQVSMLQGHKDAVNYVNVDAIAVSDQAIGNLKGLSGIVNPDADQKVLAVVKCSGLTTSQFVFPDTSEKAGETGINLKSNLLGIKHIKVDGEQWDLSVAVAADHKKSEDNAANAE